MLAAHMWAASADGCSSRTDLLEGWRAAVPCTGYRECCLCCARPIYNDLMMPNLAYSHVKTNIVIHY